MSEASRFLHTLFGYKPDDAYVLIWTGGDRRSRWFRDLDQAARYAEQRAENTDVYFGVSLAAQPYGEHERLKRGVREAAGVYGMWADIDIAGPNHSDKKVYPATLEDARGIAEDMGISPTCIVHSGGGLHCHYVLKEPRMFDTDEERDAARIMAWRWKETLKLRARQRGFDVDSVSDLERVLRVPGTLNHKITNAVRPVRLL